MKTSSKRGLRLIKEFVEDVWPMVDMKLEEYSGRARQAEDEMLAQQALASIRDKRFHALGGSVYALYPGADRVNMIRFITALQTISDYLDNLCDRAGVEDEQAFRQLHLSMRDAVDPSVAVADYYAYYPYKADNGYLKALVEECRAAIAGAPSYPLVKDKILQLVALYTDLQALKHLGKDRREEKLWAWAERELKDYPHIYRWEFSAAAGSTLGVFVLFAAAHNPQLEEVEILRLHSAYFPWIAGLHILLDYFIDSEEDIASGDLNFTHYYKDPAFCCQRLSYFIDRSVAGSMALKHPGFHLTVVKGVLAMYLTDPKAISVKNKPVTRKLIRKGGAAAVLYARICRLLRYKGKL